MEEIIRYLFFGGLTTFVNWLVYYIMLQISGNAMLISNAVAWLLAVIFAYVTNKKYVFRNKTENFGELLKEFFLFIGGRVASGLVEIFLPTFLYEIGMQQEVFGIYGAWAKGVTSILVILINYFFSKVVVFRKKQEKENRV